MAHSILEVARELIDSPEAKAAYADDPAGFMAARGLDSLSDAEMDEAVGFVAEAMPAPVARQLVDPPAPVTDSLPLARVAAATSMEAAVLEAEPGTVDLTALVDPSGQLDLPTDVGLADAMVTTDAEAAVDEAGREDAELVEDETPVDDEGDFGRGALDETAPPTDSLADADERDEPDDDAFDPKFDQGDVATHELDVDLDGPGDVSPGGPPPELGTDEEPPADDVDDVII